jgi:tRNA nucleotidyltransferase (CCA-adding enzyme)
MVVDEMSRLHTDNQEEDLYLSLAALCHDLGKSNTTKEIDGRIRAIGHENTGVPLTEIFLERLSDEKALAEKIIPLVKHHLKPLQFYKQGAKSAAIRRLANQVNISELVLLAKADYLGRTTLEAKEGVFEAGEWLLKRADELNVRNKPLPAILQGRDLIKAGLKPSKQFKAILTKAYEAQMDELFTTQEEAVVWLRRLLNESKT